MWKFLFTKSIFELAHCNSCLFFLKLGVLMRTATIEQIITDTGMMFIPVSIIHWQPYFS